VGGEERERAGHFQKQKKKELILQFGGKEEGGQTRWGEVKNFFVVGEKRTWSLKGPNLGNLGERRRRVKNRGGTKASNGSKTLCKKNTFRGGGERQGKGELRRGVVDQLVGYCCRGGNGKCIRVAKVLELRLSWNQGGGET